MVFCYAPASDAVLLSEVKTLTFVRGQKTTGRRSSPISQLEVRKFAFLLVTDEVFSVQHLPVGAMSLTLFSVKTGVEMAWVSF